MRRLSLAGEELSGKNAKIIDVALKYGYDTPESFSRAFTRFHGLSPSEAKHGGPVKTFTAITLPYMLFVTTPQLITQFVGNINNFNVIYLLSNGNPTTEKYYQAGETDILVTWLFKLTMNSQDYGLAAAIGILVFVICATLSLIVYNNSKSMKDEEAFS